MKAPLLLLLTSLGLGASKSPTPCDSEPDQAKPISAADAAAKKEPGFQALQKSVKQPDKVPQVDATTKKKPAPDPLPTRTEPFAKMETLRVGEFAIDLCRREDGGF